MENRRATPVVREHRLYQADHLMRRYGFEAVQRSLDVSSAVASTNVVGRLGFRATLQIADRLPWLHQKMFSHEPLVAAA